MSAAPPTPDAVIGTLREGVDELHAVARELTGEQLRTQTRPGEWTLAQVLSHLGSGAVITLAGLEAALDGRPAPGMEANRAVWARWDAMGPEEQRDELLAADEALMERYQGIDADTRATLRVDLGFLPEPVGLATAGLFRLHELALHSWDVRSTIAPEATVAPAAVVLLLDGVTPMLLAWLAKPEHRGGSTASLAVTLAEPTRALGLELGPTVTVGDPPQDPDGLLALPGEAWLRLLTGRLDEEHTPSSVSLSGPVDLPTLRRVFPGF